MTALLGKCECVSLLILGVLFCSTCDAASDAVGVVTNHGEAARSLATAVENKKKDPESTVTSRESNAGKSKKNKGKKETGPKGGKDGLTNPDDKDAKQEREKVREEMVGVQENLNIRSQVIEQKFQQRSQEINNIMKEIQMAKEPVQKAFPEAISSIGNVQASYAALADAAKKISNNGYKAANATIAEVDAFEEPRLEPLDKAMGVLSEFDFDGDTKGSNGVKDGSKEDGSKEEHKAGKEQKASVAKVQVILQQELFRKKKPIEVWEQLDKNKNGKLDKKELTIGLKARGKMEKAELTALVDEVYGDLDTDSNGEVTKKEFLDAFASSTEGTDWLVLNEEKATGTSFLSPNSKIQTAKHRAGR